MPVWLASLPTPHPQFSQSEMNTSLRLCMRKRDIEKSVTSMLLSTQLWFTFHRVLLPALILLFFFPSKMVFSGQIHYMSACFRCNYCPNMLPFFFTPIACFINLNPLLSRFICVFFNLPNVDEWLRKSDFSATTYLHLKSYITYFLKRFLKLVVKYKWNMLQLQFV